MPVTTSAEAVAQARRLLALPPSEEGVAWRVRRLDGRGVHFLVHTAGRVACIDAASGELLASGTALRPPVTITREAALALAAPGEGASAELVWAPTAATLSLFDPLWSVALGESVVYVDQRGKVWQTLPPKAPGGGGG